jgi:hypothetical protein
MKAGGRHQQAATGLLLLLLLLLRQRAYCRHDVSPKLLCYAVMLLKCCSRFLMLSLVLVLARGCLRQPALCAAR